MADAADAARLRDAAGAALPVGLPAAATEPVEDPLADLCVRYARTHGPFLARDVARWLGVAEQPVAWLGWRRWWPRAGCCGESSGPAGPTGSSAMPTSCGASAAAAWPRCAQEVEPVPPEALARFLPAWQGVGGRRRGVDALADVVAQLQGAPVAASVLEADVLAGRMAGYKPADLDQLCTSGEVVWVGAGGLGAVDGRVRLVFRDQAALLLPGVRSV